MDGSTPEIAEAVSQLVSLYDRPFGGKQRGRYRISMKLMRRMLGQRRVWPDQIEEIRRRLYERNYLLIDLETYFIIVSQQTFTSYRRVNEASIAAISSLPPELSVADTRAEPE